MISLQRLKVKCFLSHLNQTNPLLCKVYSVCTNITMDMNVDILYIPYMNKKNGKLFCVDWPRVLYQLIHLLCGNTWSERRINVNGIYMRNYVKCNDCKDEKHNQTSICVKMYVFP